MEPEIITLLKEMNERLGRIEELLSPTEIVLEATELSELATASNHFENANIYIGSRV